MLDVKLLRENPDFVRKNFEKRNDPNVIRMFEEFLALDRQWRDVLQEVNGLRARKNELTRKVMEAKRTGQAFEPILAEAKSVDVEIKQRDEKLRGIENTMQIAAMRLPNLLNDGVPQGKDDTENLEIKRVGKPPKFNFEPQGHQEILERLGLLDLERATKIAGRGFYFNKNQLVLLDMALQRFTIDLLMKRGYTLVNPPYMMQRKPYEGVTDLESFSDVLYKAEGEDLHLISTSEHPLTAAYMDETVLEQDLPMRFVGVSPCFRKEVGAHGKYTKGLFRVHHFNKVEQVIFANPQNSWELHEELQKNTEDIYNKLGLHFRVVNVCTGDMGIVAAKKYDTEAWMADGAFREVGSNSNCTDYQARRLNIKYREKEGAAPKGFVHTLNNTAVATSRAIIAIVEQNQRADGSVDIPAALQKYCGFKRLSKEDVE